MDYNLNFEKEIWLEVLKNLKQNLQTIISHINEYNTNNKQTKCIWWYYTTGDNISSLFQVSESNIIKNIINSLKNIICVMIKEFYEYHYKQNYENDKNKIWLYPCPPDCEIFYDKWGNEYVYDIFMLINKLKELFNIKERNKIIEEIDKILISYCKIYFITIYIIKYILGQWKTYGYTDPYVKHSKNKHIKRINKYNIKTLVSLCKDLEIECKIEFTLSGNFKNPFNGNKLCEYSIELIDSIIQLNYTINYILYKLFNYNWYFHCNRNILRKNFYSIKWYYCKFQDENLSQINKQHHIKNIISNLHNFITMMFKEFYYINEIQNIPNTFSIWWFYADIKDCYNFNVKWNSNNNIKEIFEKIEILMNFIDDKIKIQNNNILNEISKSLYCYYNLYKCMIIVIVKIIKQWELYKRLNIPLDIHGKNDLAIINESIKCIVRLCKEMNINCPILFQFGGVFHKTVKAII
jgi:hypothetical protein